LALCAVCKRTQIKYVPSTRNHPCAMPPKCVFTYALINRIEECYPLKYWSHEGNDYSDRNVPGSFMIEVMSLDARPVHGVSAITNGQLYEAYKKTPRAIEIHQKTFLNNKNENNFEEPDKQWITSYRSRYIDPGIPRADVGQFVCVDLSLPDAVLIGEFKDYLKRERKNTHESAGPFFRSPDFSSWYNMGVLPYLDLKLWEKLTGQSFQWSAFANALSTIVDKPIGSESALQKTVKKSAEKLMDYQAIRILKSQVVREQSGTLKKSGKLVVR